MPIQLTKVAYTTSASARGGRSGHVKSADGLVEFDLAQPGTTPEPAVNPETLFAAGYADDGLLDQVTRVRAELFGSLGATGHGHGSDRAVILGLEGERPETV